MSRVGTSQPLRQRLGKRKEDKAHLKYVASQPCMLCNSKPVQVHHLLKPATGHRGTARRADDTQAVPMCHEHHTALHAHGDEDAFFYDVCRNPNKGRDYAALMVRERK